MRSVLTAPSVVELLRIVERAEGGKDGTAYRIIVENVERYGVLPEEADLFAAASTMAYRDGHHLKRMSWYLAQYLGAEDYVKLAQVVRMNNSSTAEDMKLLVEAGMEPDVIIGYPYDDDTWMTDGVLSAHDVLYLYHAGVPGEYVKAFHLGLAENIDELSAADWLIRLHAAQVPVEYALALFNDGAETDRVIDCWASGLPLEYAAEVCHE